MKLTVVCLVALLGLSVATPPNRLNYLTRSLRDRLQGGSFHPGLKYKPLPTWWMEYRNMYPNQVSNIFEGNTLVPHHYSSFRTRIAAVDVVRRKALREAGSRLSAEGQARLSVPFHKWDELYTLFENGVQVIEHPHALHRTAVSFQEDVQKISQIETAISELIARGTLHG